MSVSAHQTVPCRLVADLLGSARLGQLAEVAEQAYVRAEHQVLCDDEPGLYHDLVPEGCRGVRLPGVGRLVGELRDRNGAVDRDQRPDARPNLKLEEGSRHPFHTRLGPHEDGCPIHELVEPVRGHIRRRDNRLLPEVVVEREPREEADVGVRPQEDVCVKAVSLPGVSVVAEGVQAQRVLALECEHPVLPPSPAGLGELVGVVGARARLRCLLLRRLDPLLDRRGARGRRDGLDGHGQAVVPCRTRPRERVGGGRSADLNGPLPPFREGVTRRPIAGPIHTDRNARPAGAAVDPLGADVAELTLAVVALRSLANEAQGDVLANFPGDGDAPGGGVSRRSVDHRPSGPEGRESAVCHSVRRIVSPTGRRGRDTRARHDDAHEGREGECEADLLLHGSFSSRAPPFWGRRSLLAGSLPLPSRNPCLWSGASVVLHAPFSERRADRSVGPPRIYFEPDAVKHLKEAIAGRGRQTAARLHLEAGQRAKRRGSSSQPLSGAKRTFAFISKVYGLPQPFRE